MEEFTSPDQLRAWVRARRDEGQRIGFVPTMGFLHEGHLSLVTAARQRGEAIVMSIFVNPLQFGPNEDLSRYPRDLERDRALAQRSGVDALFVPSVETMYPHGSETRIIPGETASRWEGAARPGHFAGVLTVVAKLFNLVVPDVVCFGQKDMQQALLIRRMLRDLDWPIDFVIVPTVREADGLALSSRNVYLKNGAREQALSLSRALAKAAECWLAGEKSASRIRSAMESVFHMFPAIGVEYIAIAEPESMQPVDTVDAWTVVAVAARVGTTRLIDNIVLGQGVR
ncbi:MAG: pantoate--beta-alanine ligase [Gemmatimonadota bacterium]